MLLGCPTLAPFSKGGFLDLPRRPDPATFLGVAALVMAAGLLACYVPARRAARIDPIAALREQWNTRMAA